MAVLLWCAGRLQLAGVPAGAEPAAAFEVEVTYELPQAAAVTVLVRNASGHVLAESPAAQVVAAGAGSVRVRVQLPPGLTDQDLGTGSGRAVNLTASAAPAAPAAAPAGRSGGPPAALSSPPVAVRVLRGPPVEGLHFDFPLSMGADVSICGGNHGGGSAGSSNKTHTALCEVRDATRDRVSLPPWANESRPTIYESSCYSGFCNSNALDLLSGSAIAMSNNPSCTAYAIAPPPSAEEFLNASAALRCGAFAAALEAAAAAAGNYARALPGFPGASSSPCQVPTGMTPERLSSYFYSPKAEDAMWYLDRVRELVSARGSAFREAAAAQRGEPAAGPLSEAAARLVRRPTKC